MYLSNVCMHACMCVCNCCMYACMYVCMYACVYMYMCVSTYVHMDVCMCIYTCAYLSTYREVPAGKRKEQAHATCPHKFSKASTISFPQDMCTLGMRSCTKTDVYIYIQRCIPIQSDTRTKRAHTQIYVERLKPHLRHIEINTQVIYGM